MPPIPLSTDFSTQGPMKRIFPQDTRNVPSTKDPMFVLVCPPVLILDKQITFNVITDAKIPHG